MENGLTHRKIKFVQYSISFRKSNGVICYSNTNILTIPFNCEFADVFPRKQWKSWLPRVWNHVERLFLRISVPFGCGGMCEGGFSKFGGGHLGFRQIDAYLRSKNGWQRGLFSSLICSEAEAGDESVFTNNRHEKYFYDTRAYTTRNNRDLMVVSHYLSCSYCVILVM